MVVLAEKLKREAIMRSIFWLYFERNQISNSKEVKRVMRCEYCHPLDIRPSRVGKSAHIPQPVGYAISFSYYSI